jgi:hypothetical protein
MAWFPFTSFSKNPKNKQQQRHPQSLTLLRSKTPLLLRSERAGQRRSNLLNIPEIYTSPADKPDPPIAAAPLFASSASRARRCNSR